MTTESKLTTTLHTRRLHALEQAGDWNAEHLPGSSRVRYQLPNESELREGVTSGPAAVFDADNSVAIPLVGVECYVPLHWITPLPPETLLLEPEGSSEWNAAVSVAQFLLLLTEAQREALQLPIRIHKARCREIVAEGIDRGYAPLPEKRIGLWEQLLSGLSFQKGGAG